MFTGKRSQLLRGFSAAACCLILLIINAVAQQHGSRSRARQTSPTLVFMTDFGVIDDSVALCKGVMLGVAPSLRIIDLTHQVTPYSILDGARFLAGTTPYFGAGTVFVVVVDPGVGSTRRAVVVKSKRDQYFVLPDNGLITLVQDQDGIIAAREITNRRWMIGEALSSTFHGRDIFSPVGAHIARGDNWNEVGPPVTDLVRLNITAARRDADGINGDIIALDGPYGNLVTNIDGVEFVKLGYQIGDKVSIKIKDRALTVPFVKTFSDVALEQPLLYIDSRGHIALAVNQGNFAQVYDVKPPLHIVIPVKR